MWVALLYFPEISRKDKRKGRMKAGQKDHSVVFYIMQIVEDFRAWKVKETLEDAWPVANVNLSYLLYHNVSKVNKAHWTY